MTGNRQPTKRAIIFANGEWDMETPQPVADSRTRVIAADGGARHALACGLLPDLLVGDLDSIDPEDLSVCQQNGCEIRTYPSDKEQTDLELALQAASDAGVDEIDIYAALGGRIDQQLANLLLLVRPWAAVVTTRIISGRQQIQALRGPAQLKIDGAVGDTLSILPLSTSLTGLSLAGTVWPLENQTIKHGSTRTVSNRFSASECFVGLRRGLALIVHICKE
ncbi:MAG TPA: thiamine diphosphokinase [bacterium]|nr:thiamine diphosphokinase [bacterium]HNT65636.1 thiamine diphosphokinase [bacterium]HOX86141.1 thiamine diphosphokinase [bacterium]HPG45645.1 thiamine diphosphokinase [bacterium]HPM97576.1 thiamine diphosphokinase [bacterium]